MEGLDEIENEIFLLGAKIIELKQQKLDLVPKIAAKIRQEHQVLYLLVPDTYYVRAVSKLDTKCFITKAAAQDYIDTNTLTSYKVKAEATENTKDEILINFVKK